MIQRHSLYIIYFFSSTAFGQIGASGSFEFVNIPSNARLAALGGVNVSLRDRDPNFFYSNPALTGDSLSGWASASYQLYVGDFNHSFFSYSPSFKNAGQFSIGVQHLGYGTMTAYDETGQEIGDFNSGETAIVISKSHQVNHFRFGANIKGIFSSIAGYRSTGLMLDLGGIFMHPDHDFTVGLAIKNIGFVLSEYSDSSNSSLPFDVQVGTTFKPEHMPLRFSITAYNLVPSDLAYFDASGVNEDAGTLDKVLRHFNFGIELLLHRNVNVLVGYNNLVHQELKLEQTGGGSGLSFGFSANVKSFEFVFSRSSYIVGKAAYNFTVSANLNSMMKRN